MQVLLTRSISGLKAADHLAAEELSRIKLGQEVRCEIKRVRNPKQIRLYWALIDVCWHHQDRYATKQDLSDVIKVAVGHADEVTTRTGRVVARPRSIAFGNMPQDAWEDFFSRVIEFVCQRIIPGTTDEDLRAHLEELVR